MKYVQFIFFFLITVALYLILDNPVKGIPPVGKLLSPHHGYLQNAEENALTIPDEIIVPGVNSNVTIEFDELLIPHIFADNDEDLLFAQGYITAFHRLWQMDMQLYKTSGRLSELLGPGFLEFDRSQRRKGLVYGAEQMLEELRKDKEVLPLIEAYTNGVNAYIETLTPATYPIEYKLMDSRPEKWSLFKTCLVNKEMSDQLSSGEADLEYTNALLLWGKEMVDTLYPESYANIDPVVPPGTSFDFEPIASPEINIENPSEFYSPTIAKPDTRNGSNSFIVNGAKSKDGSVLLANEPDLGLNLPSIWYVAHLNSPNFNVMGATLPGIPFVIIGFNDSSAWGDTNAKRDLVDWYKIDFKNKNRTEYRYDNKWLKTQKEIEAIRIKGEEIFYDTIVYTHYGPVTYDRNFSLREDNNINLAMRWTAHDPSQDFRTFYLLNKAENIEEFQKAYSYYTGPPQNVSYASTKGDIMIQVSGKFPIKWEGQGKFLMDGGDSRNEWKNMMPYDHLYKVVNPNQNFVSSANQHPGDSTYPYYDFDYSWEFFRNRRINDRLRKLSKVDMEDMIDLQNDNFNYMAYEILPAMMDSLDTTSFSQQEWEYYRKLEEWDYFNEANLEEPSYFELWWDILYGITWDEMEDQQVSLIKPRSYPTMRLLKENPDFKFFDRKSTGKKETSFDLFSQSFQMAVDSMSAWKSTYGPEIDWYIYKNSRINHLLRIPAFSFNQVKIGGNHNIVNAASGGHGPSWRMVVKLHPDEGVSAKGVYPGSQTGNPGNPLYGHMIENWASKVYYDLKFPVVKGEIQAEYTTKMKSK